MNQTTLHLFAWIWTAFEQPIEAGVDHTTNALSDYVQGPFRAWVVVYFLLHLLVASYSADEGAISRAFPIIFRAATIYMIIAHAPALQYWVVQPSLHWPDAIVAAIGGGDGKPVDAPAFDKVSVQAFTAGAIVFKTVPWFSFKGIVLAGLVADYWVLSLAAIGFCFFVFMGAHIAVALAASVAPICIAARMFPATASVFSGWLSVLLSAVFVKILCVVLLSILLFAEANQLADIGAPGGDDNIISVIKTLLGSALTFFAVYYATYRISGMAATITGGVYWATEHAVGARAGQAAAWVAGHFGGGGQSSGGAAGGACSAAVPFQRTVGAAP